MKEIALEITQEMVDELKNSAQLPPQVLTLMYCICAIFGQPCNVQNVRTLLKNKFFLKKVRDFSITEINHNEHKLLDKYIYNKDFEVEFVQQHSAASAILCEWIMEIHAFHSYSLVYGCKMTKDENELLGKLKCKEIKSMMHKKRNPHEEEEK